MTTNIELKEYLQREKIIMNKYKKIQTLTKFNINDVVGLAYTSNNRKYFEVVRITTINNKSVRIELISDYKRNWNVKTFKQTIFNRLFNCDDLENTVKELTEVTQFLYKFVESKINEYWKEKIEKSEQERKDKGIIPNDVWIIDEKGFHKSYTSYDISV